MNLRCRGRGFSLIELMVTVAIVALLLVMVMPSFSNSVASSRERTVVQKFVQDFDWSRSAATTRAVTLTLSANCSWSASVDGVVDTAHSMTPAALSGLAAGIACSGGTVALPATFAFTSQGFATPNGTLGFTGARGQQWPLQVLYSGSMVRVKGAS